MTDKRVDIVLRLYREGLLEETEILEDIQVDGT